MYTYDQIKYVVRETCKIIDETYPEYYIWYLNENHFQDNSACFTLGSGKDIIKESQVGRVLTRLTDSFPGSRWTCGFGCNEDPCSYLVYVTVPSSMIRAATKDEQLLSRLKFAFNADEIKQLKTLI